eukprot:5103289-Pleurochrysis_carterae.AAC.1
MHAPRGRGFVLLVRGDGVQPRAQDNLWPGVRREGECEQSGGAEDGARGQRAHEQSRRNARRNKE